MAVVRLENVWKRSDNDVIAVRDVSFEARDGEFLVLVGPSGCGKSTVLRTPHQRPRRRPSSAA